MTHGDSFSVMVKHIAKLKTELDNDTNLKTKIDNLINCKGGKH